MSLRVNLALILSLTLLITRYLLLCTDVVIVGVMPRYLIHTDLIGLTILV